MAIAHRHGVVPLQFRLNHATVSSTPRFLRVCWLGVSMLRRVWWYIKSYLPIVGILLLALGGLLVLQVHWLYRCLTQPAVKAKAVCRDAG